MKPCPLCGKGLMHSGVPLAWRVSVQRIGIDLRKVQRQSGLEQMMGNVAIASVFAPESEYGVKIDDPVTMVICEPCALANPIGLAALSDEKGGEL